MIAQIQLDTLTATELEALFNHISELGSHSFSDDLKTQLLEFLFQISRASYKAGLGAVPDQIAEFFQEYAEPADWDELETA